MVEPSFQGVNRLFVLALENEASAKGHYIPNVGIKDYNVMIDREKFFDQPIKNGKVTYENIRNICTRFGDDYTGGSLLSYPYIKEIYKMIAVDLSKQQALDANPRPIQQINFTANLDRVGNTRIYFFSRRSKRNNSKFCTRNCKSIVNMLYHNFWSNIK